MKNHGHSFNYKKKNDEEEKIIVEVCLHPYLKYYSQAKIQMECTHIIKRIENYCISKELCLQTYHFVLMFRGKMYGKNKM